MSFSNLLLSPLSPRSVQLMQHAGAAHTLCTVVSTPHHMSVRLRCVARCLQACSAWSLDRDCQLHLALRMTRLCRVALGDLFTASSCPSEGLDELKSVAAEWHRRLRVEAGVAMCNVHACQFFQENRDMCKCINSFEHSKGSTSRAATARQGIAHLMSPVNSGRMRLLTSGHSQAAADVGYDSESLAAEA